MVHIENTYNLQSALTNWVNLFLGAGFSVLASDLRGAPLPIGDELSKELAEHFKVQHGERLDLPALCTIISSTRKDELRAYLEKRFSVGWHDPRYQILDRFETKAIFTTNIDDLLYRIYTNSKTRYLNPIDLRGPAFRDRQAVDLVALHGSVVNQNKPLRFGATELATSFGTDPDQ